MVMPQLLLPSLLIVVALMLLACSGPSQDQPQPEASTVSMAGLTLPPEAIAANNRGVGLMGKYEYEPAREVFSDLLETYPKWLDVKVNLAIAVLNRQQEGDEQAALAMVDEVLASEPAHPRAHYVAGLLRLYLASPAEALIHFKQVAEADPQDAYAAYYLAQCLSQQSEHEQALGRYQQAIRLDPYLRSAYYGAFQSLQRLKRRDEARELVRVYQRLANNPRSRLAEFKYTRMGPKGEALAIDSKAPKSYALPEGKIFSSLAALPTETLETLPLRRGMGSRALSITVVDIQGDSRLDLFVADALVGEGLHNLLLLATEHDRFIPELDHPLAKVSRVNAALWGDFDNDGLTDVYLARNGANQLWRQSEPQRWQDVTPSTGTAAGEFDTVDGAVFDADHDGDLDLFLVNANGPNELLNNNLDGTFRPLAVERNIAGTGEASRTIVPADLDGDRDVDLVVINAQPPHEVYFNDRLWAYRSAPGFDAFRSLPAITGIAADRDADGIPELYTLTPDGELKRWQADEGGDYTAQDIERIDPPGHWAQLASTDMNGDGNLDLLMTNHNGWRVLSREDAVFDAVPAKGAKLTAAIPVLFDTAKGPAVVAGDTAGRLLLWQPGPGRFSFLALSLSGKEDTAQSMRSNASGIGAQVALRNGSQWTALQNYRQNSGPGQSLQPLAVGLGGAKRADFVAIDWSDGVYQSELDLDVGKLHLLSETQRQLSSCPVLFAWDGEKYAFVSDLLGVGGIGYAIAPGEYAEPRPWENFLLELGLLQPRKGRYVLKIGEPMEEVAYLDHVRLVAYDLPPGWRMVLDERMGIQDPAPSGEPRFYRQERLPQRALNERAQDVTESLLQADGVAAPVGALDRRFIGRLKSEHVLTLSFSEPLHSGTGSPVLVVDGWVEYPYSQTMFAAWQAGADFQAPSIEVRGADGRWHSVLEQFGYPAGMPRRMSVPLQSLPSGATALRLRTNMEIYWDRIAVAYAEPLPESQSQSLALVSSRLAKTGFAKRTTAAQRRPHYDYSQRSPFWDTRYMQGYYTRFGPVEELVNSRDDAVAIIGPGEELHLEFAAPQYPTKPGWTRYFVLETRGWAKDMDMFTKDGETIGPLPHTGLPAQRRNLLHARYHTRYLAGR